MNFWNFTRSPASVRLLLDFARSQGLATAPLLAGSRLNLTQLGHAERSVSPGQELAVIGNLLRLLPAADPAALGLRAGLGYHASAYGVLGMAWLSSATGAEALQLAQRFLPLTFAYVSIGVQPEGDHIALVFDAPPTLDDAVRRFAMTRAMGAVACVLHDIIGPTATLHAVTLRGPAPPAPLAHGAHAAPRHLLGAGIKWGARRNMLAIDQTLLAQPLPQANATTAALCERMCEELVARRRTQLNTATLVREYLAALPDHHHPQLADAAALLHTSERTLKRWLQNDGASFSELLQTTRRAKADRLLADPALTLTEAAACMGYGDLSAFSQAYKRWSGVAPIKAKKILMRA